MSTLPEARLSWQKALRKLEEARRTPVDTFPGIVVTSSYFAMRHAAVAVLLQEEGRAPSAESAIIARFGTVVGDEGRAHGAAFNRVFDLRTVEDYDPVESPSTSDATAARDDAQKFLKFCSERLGLSMDLSQANAEA